MVFIGLVSRLAVRRKCQLSGPAAPKMGVGDHESWNCCMGYVGGVVVQSVVWINKWRCRK